MSLLNQRNFMLLKKEAYSNNMFELETLKKMVLDEPQLQFLDSHHRKIHS
jgi:hypothetical protein